MKKLITSFLMLAAFAASASELCESIGNFAATTMKGRQDGVPMSRVMTFAEQRNNEVLKLMILQAYEVPRFSTQEYKDKAVADFRNLWELACYKQERKETL